MAALDPAYSDQIMGFEGFTPQANWDYRQYSNGYGTKAQYPGEKIDQDTAKQRFDTEIGKAADTVDAVLPENTPPGVRAGLISLTYNAGPGWINSGLGQAVKSGDWQTAQDRFLQYNKAGGQVNPGLVNRRQQEAAWFNAPPISGPQQVANTNSAQPLSAPQSLAPQQPLAPQPLNLANIGPQGAQASGFSPQAQPAQPIETQMPPLNAPQIQQIARQLNLARAFQKIPLPAGFKGYQIG